MKKASSFVLVAVGLLLLLGTIGYGFYRHALENPAGATLPEQIGDLPLTRSVTGGQAVMELNQMHGQAFPLTSGAIGVYGDTGQATLWVSGAPFTPLANRMLAAMRTRIAEGSSPFTPLETTQVAGHTVYALQGLGQRHYYFRSGRLLVWLGIDAELAGQALEEVLVFYP